jgi:hypothetical protein
MSRAWPVCFARGHFFFNPPRLSGSYLVVLVLIQDNVMQPTWSTGIEAFAAMEGRETLQE